MLRHRVSVEQPGATLSKENPEGAHAAERTNLAGLVGNKLKKEQDLWQAGGDKLVGIEASDLDSTLGRHSARGLLSWRRLLSRKRQISIPFRISGVDRERAP